MPRVGPGTGRRRGAAAAAPQKTVAIAEGTQPKGDPASGPVAPEGALSGGIAMAPQAAGATPLEVQLATMRQLWDEARAGGVIVDPEKARAACALAKETAPFVHPRLSATDGRGSEGDPVAHRLELDPAILAVIAKIARRDP